MAQIGHSQVQCWCDVLIAGGGPASLAAAIALAERDLEVVVVDPKQDLDEPARCEMLPQAARAILERLGIVTVLDYAVPLGGHMSIWASNNVSDHSELTLGGQGWSLDRNIIGAHLRKRARSLAVNFDRMRANNVAGEAGNWSIELLGPSGKKIVRCRYLIDASGRQAKLARRLGGRLTFGPKLVAIACDVSTGDFVEQGPRLLVEATRQGWWYALPRNGGGATFGYLTSGSAMTEAKLDPHRFLHIASEQLRLVPLPSRFIKGACITFCDSRNALLNPVSGSGWLATGDAAAAFDPVSSQGLFNALSAGFFAGNAAADWLDGDHDGSELYARLLERTASRTHTNTPLQYAAAARNLRSAFWISQMSNRTVIDGAKERAFQVA